MTATTPGRTSHDDPRRLREMLGKVSSLAAEHRLSCVVVGMAGFEGDLLFPEVVDFVESALRMDDAIVRMTRERSVLFLTDVDRSRAQEIMERVLADFHERFTPVQEPAVAFGYFEVTPEMNPLTIKEVLPALFTSSPVSH